MAKQGVRVPVVGECHAAVGTPHDMLASVALEVGGESAAIIENEGLFATLERILQPGKELG